MSNNIVFFEIATSDLARARGFYGELFGWKFTDMPGASMIDPGPGMLNEVPGHAGGESIVIYIGVDDVRASHALALSLGATELMPPRNAPGKGSFSVFRDRDNNRIGVFGTKPLE